MPTVGIQYPPPLRDGYQLDILSLAKSEWSRNGFDFEFELDLYIVKKNLICQCNINSWLRLAHCWADTAVRLHLNIIFRRSEGGGATFEAREYVSRSSNQDLSSQPLWPG